VTAGRPLSYGDPAHLAAHQFLVEEAALLDAADYAGWLELLCQDIRYVMPVRVTTARGAGSARREITVDESVLRTQNLAVFL
jgi:3-phenylpropionate/cinnamic acid dioxygenase small subunit